MSAILRNAWGYQGDAMNLPVADVGSAIPFYESAMGFRVESRSADPGNAVVLVRDEVRIRLAENGGDPTQDGCAFQVTDVEALHLELKDRQEWFSPSRNASVSPELKTENRDDGSSWRVFFVVAPDGLCYWFGEQLTMN
jgi:lactoylglutathione lyase